MVIHERATRRDDRGAFVGEGEASRVNRAHAATNAVFPRDMQSECIKCRMENRTIGFGGAGRHHRCYLWRNRVGVAHRWFIYKRAARHARETERERERERGNDG